jgi:hypothetical protein
MMKFTLFLLICLLVSVGVGAFTSQVPITSIRQNAQLVETTPRKSNGRSLIRPPSTRKAAEKITEIPETYPIGRKKLIQKAREIDPSLKAGNTSGSYSTVGWSNRLGTVLTPAAIPGVYTACRPFLWNTIDVGCRMTVIELSTRTKSDKPDLFVHSPVLLDNPLKEALAKLGTVKHVISPNYEHVKFAKMWGEAFPEAKMWGCPGMMECEPEVNWTGEIPFSARPPSYESASSSPKPAPVEGMWDWEEIQPLHFDTEVNPFTGRAFFNEVVFYHTASKTLMTTDTYWNYPKEDGVTNSNYEDMEDFKSNDYGSWELAPALDGIPIGSRLWKKGMDKLFKPFYLNLMVKNDKKDEFKDIALFISGIGNGGWDVETIIPAHGDLVRGSSEFTKSVLKKHFNL